MNERELAAEFKAQWEGAEAMAAVEAEFCAAHAAREAARRSFDLAFARWKLERDIAKYEADGWRVISRGQDDVELARLVCDRPDLAEVQRLPLRPWGTNKKIVRLKDGGEVGKRVSARGPEVDLDALRAVLEVR